MSIGFRRDDEQTVGILDRARLRCLYRHVYSRSNPDRAYNQGEPISYIYIYEGGDDEFDAPLHFFVFPTSVEGPFALLFDLTIFWSFGTPCG